MRLNDPRHPWIQNPSVTHDAHQSRKLINSGSSSIQEAHQFRKLINSGSSSIQEAHQFRKLINPQSLHYELPTHETRLLFIDFSLRQSKLKEAFE
jgi:cellobiose-specific phosphotransferase system component IIA